MVNLSLTVRLTAFLIVFVPVLIIAQTPKISPSEQIKPKVDHHQHLFSAATLDLLSVTGTKPLTAEGVIGLLDEAGINRGVILSVAYMYGRPGREPQDEYTKVRAENDWTGAQAAQHQKRLTAFCGFNPLKDYALDELARCSKDANLRRGIKMHFGNSDVQLENPEHLEKLTNVFRAANSNRMAIVVHLRASISLNRAYGREQARIFLEELLPLAPDITVQVAHLAGSGPGFDDAKSHAVLEVLANAVEKRDRRTRNLWFDVTTVAVPQNSPELSALLVKRIRQIGVKRILYGSDAPAGGNLRPREGWAAFCRIGLSSKEIKQIAKNVAPYVR